MSSDRQDPPSERSANAAGGDRSQQGDPAPEAVAQIEQAMLRMRHDQARRRLRRHGGGREGRGDDGRGAGWGDGDPGSERGQARWSERGRGHGWGHGHGPDRDGRPGESQPGSGPDVGADFGPGRDSDAQKGPRGPRGPHDRSLGQAARFRMLDALRTADDGIGISALAEAIGVDQPRASRLVAEATDRGHVRRAVDPNDGRRSVVQLTEAGRTVLTEAHRGRRDAVTTALSGFTPEETARFAELFTRFVAAWPGDEE